VNLPDEKIVLDGFLMKTPKEIDGKSNTCLHIRNNPIIIQSQKINSKAPRSNPIASSKYIFREVNFISENLDALFVLQNKNEDITIIFEDCHISFKGYLAKSFC
jgi:hypothetical protein